MRLLEKELNIDRFNTTIDEADYGKAIIMGDQLYMHIKFGYRVTEDKPQTMAEVKSYIYE